MTRWSLFLQTLSLLHHFLGLYSRGGFGSHRNKARMLRIARWQREPAKLGFPFRPPIPNSQGAIEAAGACCRSFVLVNRLYCVVSLRGEWP